MQRFTDSYRPLTVIVSGAFLSHFMIVNQICPRRYSINPQNLCFQFFRIVFNAICK